MDWMLQGAYPWIGLILAVLAYLNRGGLVAMVGGGGGDKRPELSAAVSLLWDHVAQMPDGDERSACNEACKTLSQYVLEPLPPPKKNPEAKQ